MPCGIHTVKHPQQLLCHAVKRPRWVFSAGCRPSLRVKKARGKSPYDRREYDRDIQSPLPGKIIHIPIKLHKVQTERCFLSACYENPILHYVSK
jgi:hypothetical protein